MNTINATTSNNLALLDLSADQLETLARLKREQQNIASQMTAVLGGLNAQTAVIKPSFGRPSHVLQQQTSGKKRGRKKGFKVSAETRAKIAEKKKEWWAQNHRAA